ncbi:MAG TPA: sigma 54-interacting transcriptional regulator [Pyrinomonadaceae bacterium]
MKLLALKLAGAGAEADGWLEELARACRGVEVTPEDDAEVARRVVWAGLPFILTGQPRALDAYLMGLGNDEAEILKDCAYFWLLTENEDYNHPRLPQDRLVVLGWRSSGQYAIRDALQLLAAYPKLDGLSRRMHFIREEIRRISAGPVSPGYSVLIIGDSGVGKDVVAGYLFESSERGRHPARQHSGLHPVGGAWLHMEPGMALTELIGLAPNRSQRGVGYPGLLKLFRNGALFLDDFESAPLSVQETLLRIMSHTRGKPAPYRPVGGTADEETHVWLLFATNADLGQLRDGGKIREDFLYRFEDRVLVIPPLKDRPADFPAIAHSMWRQLWEATGREEVDVLRSGYLREIYGRRLKWEGNVRTLRALFALVVSMRCNPAHNHVSPSALIETILARGDTYWHWVRILETEYYITGQSLVDEIRNADADFYHQGSGPAGHMDEKQLLPSERRAQEVLTREGWRVFKSLVSKAPRARGRRVVRVSVRLARIVWYVSQKESIDWRTARDITGVKSEETAVRDLAVLANYSRKNPRKKEPLRRGRALLSERQDGTGAYVKVAGYFV